MKSLNVAFIGVYFYSNTVLTEQLIWIDSIPNYFDISGQPGEKGERGSPGVGTQGQRGIPGPPGMHWTKFDI